MHEPLLALAALPAPTIVCGLLLRPFSLGHQLYLIRENPVFSGSAVHGSTVTDTEFAALIAAVLICSQSWDESRRMTQDRLLPLKLWIWKRRLRRAVNREPLNRITWLLTFHRYLEAGAIEFPLSEIARPDRPSVSRSPGCPFLLRLHSWIMRELRLTESQAWDYPLGLAKMRWACHWEQESGLDIYNAHDAVFDAFVRDQEAKREQREMLRRN